VVPPHHREPFARTLTDCREKSAVQRRWHLTQQTALELFITEAMALSRRLMIFRVWANPEDACWDADSARSYGAQADSCCHRRREGVQSSPPEQKLPELKSLA